jgi:hypothetical protein
MDEKDDAPQRGQKTESAKRAQEKGEGRIRSRERSFRQQRAAILRPSEDETAAADKTTTTASEAKQDQARDEPTHASPDEDRQKLMAQYRRRQRQRDETPDTRTREERAPSHASSTDSSDPRDGDVDPP